MHATLWLSVLRYNGADTAPVEAAFDGEGGTIGRALSNRLVLADPKRTVSRVQARVLARDEGFFIEDIGSNPILVNGQPLGHGHAHALGAGDRLHIGGYELSARVEVELGAGTGAHAPVLEAADGGPDLARVAPGALAGGVARPARPARPASPAALPDLGFDPAEAMRPYVEPPVPAPARPVREDAWALDSGFMGVPGVDAPEQTLIDPVEATVGRNELRTDGGIAMPGQRSAAADLGQGEPTPARAVLSWSDGGARQATIVAPEGAAIRNGSLAARVDGVSPGAHAAHADHAAQGAQAAHAASRTRPLRATPLASSPALGSPAQRSTDALARAFAEGLGAAANGVTLPAELTPELMLRLGQVLAEALDGTVRLLQQRASVKREIDADSTRIQAHQNNPLKFSPNAASALQHLLGRTVPGFLPPQEAMRDAWLDLCAHEAALVDATRQALAEQLQALAPAAIESTAAAPAGLAGLWPGSRPAALWAAFVQRHGELAAEGARPGGALAASAAAHPLGASLGRAYARALSEHAHAQRQSG